jgi:hypothetical protein
MMVNIPIIFIFIKLLITFFCYRRLNAEVTPSPKHLTQKSEILHKTTRPVPTFPARDSQVDRKGSYEKTNYEILSTVNTISDFENNYSDSVYDIGKELYSWKVGFYPTFGTKYPYSDAVEDATEEESTTKQIKIEDLENQLFNVLDKLADRHTN